MIPEEAAPIGCDPPVPRELRFRRMDLSRQRHANLKKHFSLLTGDGVKMSQNALSQRIKGIVQFKFHRFTL